MINDPYLDTINICVTENSLKTVRHLTEKVGRGPLS